MPPRSPAVTGPDVQLITDRRPPNRGRGPLLPQESRPECLNFTRLGRSSVLRRMAVWGAKPEAADFDVGFCLAPISVIRASVIEPLDLIPKPASPTRRCRGNNRPYRRL